VKATDRNTGRAKHDVEEPVEETPAKPELRVAGSDCVVKSAIHVGRAVMGRVCSYHAMHYDAEGNRR